MKPDREIEQILASGEIEEYCLGTLSEVRCRKLEELARLYPEIRAEVEQTRFALDHFFSATTGQSSGTIKQRIFDRIFTPAEVDSERLSDSQFINRYSRLETWKEKIKDAKRPENAGNIYLHQILNEGKTLQFVAWVRQNVDAEIHEDMVESFMVLEGTCRCLLGDVEYNLGPGDYLEIPLFTNHSVEVTSNVDVKAILQRILL